MLYGFYDKRKQAMIATVVICAVTCAAVILSVLFFPVIKLGKVHVDTYWIVALLGAAALLLSGQTDVSATFGAFVRNDAVNPLKILALFLCMTVLSVFLDELGFFRYVASAVLKRARGKKLRLFFSLYLIVSLLTVFTSNDVIILSFTPFILYFCKSADLDPLPYLSAEFVAANTWSAALVVGNPTNMYLSSACDVDFFSYLEWSALPTLLAGAAALGALLLLFRKQLRGNYGGTAEEVVLTEKPLLWIGAAHLLVCILFLAVGPYFGIEMWIVSLAAVGSLFVCTLIYSLVRRKRPSALLGCLKRAPYPLIPFMLSMFVLVEGLSLTGATEYLSAFFGTKAQIWTYGAGSFLMANLINNIPMSVLFYSVLSGAGAGLPAVMATAVGSNLGAFFTPVGALAGIMFGAIVRRHGVKFGFAEFLKMGVCVALPALAAALGGLSVMALLL